MSLRLRFSKRLTPVLKKVNEQALLNRRKILGLLVVLASYDSRVTHGDGSFESLVIPIFMASTGL